MRRNNRFLEPFQHFLVSFTLILKGFDKVSHHAVIGSIILLFGFIIFGFFLYSIIKKHHNEQFTLIAHWFEAIACLFTAYIFFTEGATYLPYVFLLAAIGFFIAIYVHHKKGHSHH